MYDFDNKHGLVAIEWLTRGCFEGGGEVRKNYTDEKRETDKQWGVGQRDRQREEEETTGKKQQHLSERTAHKLT